MASSTVSRSFPVRFFLFFWHALTTLRTIFFNLIFLIILIVILLALFAPDGPELPDHAPLLITPKGMLVDQLAHLSPQEQLLNPGRAGSQEVLLRELVRVIDTATHDQRVSGLILGLDQFQGGGVSKVREVGAALDRFKESGKPIVAYADHYNQQQYFLASYADEIILHDLGAVAITGFGLYRSYFKQALDKLHVDFHIFKVGQFKDFVEPYIRDDMSAASREHNSQWLHELWSIYSGHVEQRRGLAEGTLTEWINHLADHLAKHQGNSAEMAREMGLVDQVMSRVARRQHFVERFGAEPEQADEFLHVAYDHYKKKALPKKNRLESGNIALVVARGTILDGEQPEGTIGGDSLSRIINRVGQDSDIKALVLRIDSGGGSAFASELVRREIQSLRDKGITVVVSMGSVAASGGYWMALAADEIWATPTTITGSIGVFGLFPTMEKGLAKLGIHTDGVGTTELAGGLRVDRALSHEAANVLQQGVEDLYDRFIQLTADSRQKSPEAIHEIAQGRVWTGAAAERLGLVDALGNLDDAIASAAQRAGITAPQIKLFERELSPRETLIRELLRETQVTTSLDSVLANWNVVDLSALQIMLHSVKHSQQGDGNAPRAAYALCLACFAP